MIVLQNVSTSRNALGGCFFLGYCKRKKLFDQCCTCIAPSSSALLRIRGDALFIFITKKSRVAVYYRLDINLL